MLLEMPLQWPIGCETSVTLTRVQHQAGAPAMAIAPHGESRTAKFAVS